MASRHPPADSRRIRRRFDARVRRGIARCRLTERRGPILVGFSGGADSTALLLALASLLPPTSRLLALHVDHGLRGPRSERDAAHAERLARARGIPFRKVRARVREGSRRGPEAAAREARRTAFLEVAEEVGAEAVALAHTRDDQVETVLMRLFEGSGLRGLVGMRPEAPLRADDREGGRVVLLRPLLEVSRDEVRDYLRASGVEWVEDETNEDERRPRNAVRRRLWPVIEELMGAAAAEGVAASAEHLAAALEVLSGAVRRAAEAHIAEEGGRIRIAPLARVAALPQAVRAGLWREALARARRGAPGRPGRRPLGRLLEAMDRLARRGGPSSRLDLPGGLEARRTYEALELGPRPGAAPPGPGAVPLPLPGRASILGVEVRAEEVLSREAAGATDGRSAVLLDAGRIEAELVLRTRREGDRFQAPGGRGERKLKDYFIDRKIPRAERDGIPLVAAGRSVVWIVGHAPSGKYRVGPRSRHLLLMRAAPAAEKNPGAQ